MRTALRVGAVYQRHDGRDTRKLVEFGALRKAGYVRYVRPSRRKGQKYSRWMHQSAWLKWVAGAEFVEIEGVEFSDLAREHTP